MSIEVTIEEPAFVKPAPTVGTRLPLWSPPNARSVEATAPKLYVSPALFVPAPVLYVVFAFVPVSLNAQPAGTALDVPVEASESKSWPYVVSSGGSGVSPAASAGADTARAVVATASSSSALRIPSPLVSRLDRLFGRGPIARW